MSCDIIQSNMAVLLEKREDDVPHRGKVNTKKACGNLCKIRNSDFHLNQADTPEYPRFCS